MYKSIKINKKFEYSLILLGFFICITLIIKYYFEPFFIIIILFSITKPIYNFFTRVGLFNRNINSALSLIIVNFLAVIFLINGGKVLINNLDVIVVKNFPEVNSNIREILFSYINTFRTKLFMLNFEMTTLINNFINNDFLKKGAIFTTDSISAYMISNFITYFLLIDKKIIIIILSKIFPSIELKMLKDKLSIFEHMIKIELILVLITTLVTIIGFLFLGVSNPLFLGILCGIFDIVPYIGTILIFIPLILLKIYAKEYFATIALVTLYVLLQVIRQIMENRFMSDKLNIHPLIILVSVYLGVKIFGVIGVFMAPLYVILTKELIFTD
ncbi:AI-2E family transporter [Clostridium sediminicola]|uniref:AI-2E family transporter n=1 Tax=Clostridium sediminicola TaxID=3114879 RepID=UPI0031F1F78A